MQKKKSTEASSGNSADVVALTRALAAPFSASEVRFKPGVVSGSRALALAYVDARAIQDRLDEVLGVEGWQDDYQTLPDGSVICRLRLRLGEEWVTKVDVGSPSDQPDGGDRVKAAFSDALKRAAVKFGIGRYLYRLPGQWVNYDPQRRQLVNPPSLQQVAQTGLQEAPQAQMAAPRHQLPANGAELQRRLYDYDARLAKEGLCKPGELVKHVVRAGAHAGHAADLAAWTGPAITLAVDQTKAFEMKARASRIGEKEVA